MNLTLFQKTYKHQNKGSKTIYEVTLMACLSQALKEANTNFVIAFEYEKYTESNPKRRRAEIGCIPKTRLEVIKNDFKTDFMSWIEGKLSVAL